MSWTNIACSVCTNPSASATPQDESLVSTKWMLKNKDPKQSFKKKTEKQGNWKEANQMPDILMTQLPNPCLSFLAWSTAATFSNEFIGQTPQLVINSSTKGQLNRWLVVCVGGFGFLASPIHPLYMKGILTSGEGSLEPQPTNLNRWDAHIIGVVRTADIQLQRHIGLVGTGSRSLNNRIGRWGWHWGETPSNSHDPCLCAIRAFQKATANAAQAHLAEKNHHDLVCPWCHGQEINRYTVVHTLNLT